MRPITIALRTDFQWATGLRLLKVYLDRARVIRDSNVKIVNLVMDEDGKSRQISTGEELLNARSAVCSFFVDALVAQILREDYRDELKNSESASGPSS